MPSFKQMSNHVVGMMPKLGTGARFAQLENKLDGKKGVTNPAGLAAYIGREKYGKKKFQKLAAKGKKKSLT